MSTFAVPVVKIESIRKHPDADTLSITDAEGCPVIFRTGDFQEGDLAIYVPIEAVVPLSNKAFSFLSDKEGKKTFRIKAKKLRGIFSMGLLVKPSDVLLKKFPEVGDDVSGPLEIVKYVEPEKPMKLGGAVREKQPQFCPVYDIESYRKYKREFVEGEEVVVTEKIHGCNARFTVRKGEDDEAPRLYVGSRNYFNKETIGNVWWKVARDYPQIETALAKHDGYVLYGEVYGQVQDLKYGTSQEDPVRFAAFDVFDLKAGKYLNYDDFLIFCLANLIPTVPVLYRGPYLPEAIEPLAAGDTTIPNAAQIREGFVIKPVVERWSDRLGRVIAKLVGEQYLLRKGGTEFQ
jgi:RNA ligase (TIGR02306 family)